jgi:hypothetical protein
MEESIKKKRSGAALRLQAGPFEEKCVHSTAHQVGQTAQMGCRAFVLSPYLLDRTGIEAI